ncbi:NACHT, LRR and PYD domains-containing protein 3-like isoform X1 [Poecilia latipinna]|uniref:NACHT, LRR and PYD domains-containing protein 3-like isoform X1 n=1 Tax=Poecilia latipinna TaxID=48699 RepID=UPI00072EB9A8|nr:PREDICTED: NACHT, LRR and PYD domains-containing protein 3-like isoform X1 [Poecilia latipinna]
MKGVPGIGKTFQTKMFMIDWAKGKSNKHIKALVTFDFKELNTKKNEVKSMESLLDDFFNKKNAVISIDDKNKICFILDGLEECKLPLDFVNNKEVKDLKEAASTDVLLTNLIKGNLLPDARIWIISQPQGVKKIPSEYIEKTVQCQETDEQRKNLQSCLKVKFLKEITDEKEEISHPNQRTTEHIIRRENGSEEVESKENKFTKVVTSTSEIFKDGKGKETRTVMTTGGTGIGKSFHMKKFIKEWAKKGNDTWPFFTWIKDTLSGAKPVELLFLIDFSKLNFIKNTNISLFGLLNDFFEETKNIIISDYSQLNIMFLLDGLDAYQHLDFEKYKESSLTDVREPSSVDVLLINLIRGNLLPKAKVWITSQPPAAEKIPDGLIDRLTEIREKPDITSQKKLKSQLKDQFTSVSEGIDGQKTSALLNEVFTDLYIIEGERAQNEIMQVQDAKFKTTNEETSIKYCDIFKPANSNQNITTVLTVGVAGIGKTFASMKYILDWAESKATENIFFILPLPFRELNLRSDKEHSLEDLIHQFFPAMRTSEITDYDKYNILIVLDGFDECRLDLEFKTINKCSDVRTPTTMKVLLSNLILGNLLPKAQIWITSRPAASNNIPPEKVDRMTEVRGFNDEQKEKYFMKRFNDAEEAEKIWSYVKKSRCLYMMCHIPVFCFITSKVLEDFVKRNQDDGLPKTLTDMYTHFLLLQRRQTKAKYNTDQSTSETSGTETFSDKTSDETILSLGKLAFKGLEEKNLLFTEEDLTSCGTDVTKAAVFSGLLTQIKRENHDLYKQNMFCFVHQSIQEFMAALHVFYSFTNKGENVFTESTSATSDLTASEFYKKAVNKAFESEHGDWDMFLRFLVGLSLESNQDLLQDLMDKNEKHKDASKEAAEYIKKKIRENNDPDKNLNLFYCLNELNDHSLVQEIKDYLNTEEKPFENFTDSQWSALTFVLLTSDENLEVFDLKKYLESEKVLLGMMPVVKVSNTTLLSWCELSGESCNGLTSSVLTKPSSNLTLLDLSHNDLMDAGVMRLADGLKHVNCKLETLKLAGCQVTERGCISLAEAIKSNRVSSLKHLDLSYNHPGDKGMRALNAIVEDPNKKLEPVNFDYEGKLRLKPGWSKYGADLMFDKTTASRRLVLVENNKKAKTDNDVKKQKMRNTSDEMFKRTQVFCDEGLKRLCYWEVEWKGVVGIAVAYKDVGRTWNRDGGLGCNDKSWSLLCSKTGYKAMHKNTKKEIKVSTCNKIGVFLDWERGTLRYYSISSEKRSLIHTFKAKFRAELFPAFWFKKGSVTLCDL